MRTWDASNGRCLLLHAFDRGSAKALAFDRPGDRLAVLLSEGTLVVFERLARDGLTWLQPARSYPGPGDVEYRAQLTFDSDDHNVVVTTWADSMSDDTVRIVEVSGVTASDASSGDANDIAQANVVAAGHASQSSQPMRLRVSISGGV